MDPRDAGNVGPDEPAPIAPDDRAVTMSVLAMKQQARWLRRARPQPFGFAPDSPHPTPERIGAAHGAGTASSGLASVLGRRTAIWTMSIIYGDTADESAQAARVISDFHQEMQDRALADTLHEAASTWPCKVTPTDAVGPAGSIDVVLSGTAVTVPLLRLAELTAFQIRSDRVLVTVLARHMGSDIPEIVRLTDLEPMLSALDNPNREIIAATLTEVRRWRSQEMRSQGEKPDTR